MTTKRKNYVSAPPRATKAQIRPKTAKLLKDLAKLDKMVLAHLSQLSPQRRLSNLVSYVRDAIDFDIPPSALFGDAKEYRRKQLAWIVQCLASYDRAFKPQAGEQDHELFLRTLDFAARTGLTSFGALIPFIADAPVGASNILVACCEILPQTEAALFECWRRANTSNRPSMFDLAEQAWVEMKWSPKKARSVWKHWNAKREGRSSG